MKRMKKTKSLYVLFIIVFIIIIILMCFLLKLLCTNKNIKHIKEYFSNTTTTTEDDTDSEKKNKWKKRFQELEKIQPYKYKDYFKPMVIYNHEHCALKPQKIFVSIPSYRDDQCSDTLMSLVQQADHPEHLHIFICEQNSIIDRNCLDQCKVDKTCSLLNVKIERLSYREAKGPLWARFRINQHYDGEEYYLQLDSHIRMIKHWDTILKNQLELCGGSNAVLTQYPCEFINVPRKDRNNPVKEKWKSDKLRGPMYVKSFGDEGFFRITSNYTTDISRQPFRATAIAAGFMFSKGTLLKDCYLFDPYQFLFFGEETDLTIQAFCAGYDIYSPNVNICYHLYTRNHRNTYWELKKKELETLSRFRLYVKLGYLRYDDIPKEYRFILTSIGVFKPKTVRSIEEYEKYAGVSLKEEKVLKS